MDLSQFSAKDIVGPVRLVTDSRDVKVEQFTVSLDLQTERGDIQLTPGYAPALHRRALRIGPHRPSAAVQSSLQPGGHRERGDAVNDFGPPIEKEVSGRTATLTGRTGDGPTIRLTADRGWISVRKEGTPSSLPEGMPPKAPKPPDPRIYRSPSSSDVKASEPASPCSTPLPRRRWDAWRTRAAASACWPSARRYGRP